MFCLRCGKELPNDARFCLACGYELKYTADTNNSKAVDSSTQPETPSSFSAQENINSEDTAPTDYSYSGASDSPKKKVTWIYIAIAVALLCVGILIVANVKASYFKAEELPFYGLECGMDIEDGRDLLGNPDTSYIGEVWGDYGYCTVDVYDSEFVGFDGILSVYYSDEDEFVYANWSNDSLDFDEYEDERYSEYEYPNFETNEEVFDKITKMNPNKLTNTFSRFTHGDGGQIDPRNTDDDITYSVCYDWEALREGAKYVKAVETCKDYENKHFDMCFYYRNSNEEDDYIENYPCPWED